MANVVISYSSKDDIVVKNIFDFLKEKEIDVWMALPENIHAGSSYEEEIRDQIKDCKIVLVIFSKESINSEWVKREVNLAVSYSKYTLPFKIDQTPLKGSPLELALNIKHWIDAYPEISKQFERLVNDIKYLLNDSPDFIYSVQEIKSITEPEIYFIKNIYRECFSEEENTSIFNLFLSINDFIEEKRKSFIFALKKNNEVIGFIDLTYGIESQYVFISYIAISKEKSKDDEILFTGIFIELLFDFLLKQHYIIKGILFEIEGDVRLRLFKRALKTQKYYLYLVDIDYYQLSMPCDGEAGSTSRKPMNLIFVSHERRKNGLEKQELLTMLWFIFSQIYVDLTDDDEDEYIDILKGYYDEYVEKLPDIIPLK